MLRNENAASEPIVHYRITAKRSWFNLGFRDLWRFRELARILAARDIKLRYRQTALGVAGVVLQPVLNSAVLTFVFGEVASLPSEGVPYFAFAFAGFLGWNVFSGLVTRAAGSLVSNATLVSKIYVPRLLLPISSVFVVAFDFVIAAAIMAVTMVVYGIGPTWTLVFAPLWLMALVAVAVGIGAAASAVMVHYRDIGTGVAAALQAVLYLTPIAYSATAVPDNLRGLYRLNPLATLVEGLRWSVLDTTRPSAGRIAVAAAGAALTLVAGCVVFNRVERSLADVI